MAGLVAGILGPFLIDSMLGYPNQPTFIVPPTPPPLIDPMLAMGGMALVAVVLLKKSAPQVLKPPG